MSLDSLTRFSLEGPGSVPVRCGSATARGMFDAALVPTKATGQQQVEADQIVLHLFHSVLPEAQQGEIIEVGVPDLSGTNDIGATPAKYFIAFRRPVQDGLVHALMLEGNV